MQNVRNNFIIIFHRPPNPPKYDTEMTTTEQSGHMIINDPPWYSYSPSLDPFHCESPFSSSSSLQAIFPHVCITLIVSCQLDRGRNNLTHSSTLRLFWLNHLVFFASTSSSCLSVCLLKVPCYVYCSRLSPKTHFLLESHSLCLHNTLCLSEPFPPYRRCRNSFIQWNSV